MLCAWKRANPPNKSMMNSENAALIHSYRIVQFASFRTLSLSLSIPLLRNIFINPMQ